MKRVAALTAAGLLAIAAVLGTAGPTQAQSVPVYQVGCWLDDKRVVNEYPVHGGQDVYVCRFSPNNNFWELSYTCGAGTHPEAILNGPYHTSMGQEFYVGITSCVAN